MFLRDSRYAKTKAFDEDPVLGEVFRGVRPRAIGPATGVLEHVVRSGERLDLLARHYYNDSRLWWRIVDANPGFLYGGDMTLEAYVGQVIVIPRATE
jgi:nucleoid-associated protein YgaU